MAMEMDGPFPIEHLDEWFEGEVAVWRRLSFRFVFLESFPLFLVGLSFGENLTLKRAIFMRVPGAAPVPYTPLGFSPLANLIPPNMLDENTHRLGSDSLEFDVKSLPTDGVARARHNVGRGHTSRQGHANAGIVGVDGVVVLVDPVAQALSFRSHPDSPRPGA